MDIFEEIDKKKATLDSMGLSAEAKQKLDKKLHLEWSFHSNHIEGNTLTYGQTQMLLMFGKAIGDKEKREYDEMEAHHVAIKMIEEWAADQTRELTERDIRELNEIILVKPFWKDAIDSLGQKTKRMITPGEYKQMPNSVLLSNGEIHEYASPEETPAKMNDLMDKYRNLIEQKEHPIFIASWFHHRFVAIHPFDDGNGRVARLLANYILLRHQYIPIVIKTENKPDYLTALQQADIGDIKPFMRFLTKELHWSMDLAIKAAKGESLEEDDDLDKQIALLKKKVSKESFIKEKKNKKLVKEIIASSFVPIVDKVLPRLDNLKELFFKYDKRLVFGKNPSQHYDFEKQSGGYMISMDKYPECISKWMKNHIHQGDESISYIGFNIKLNDFRVQPENGIEGLLSFAFYEYEYEVSFQTHYNTQQIYTKKYDEILTEDEIRNASSLFVKEIVFRIDTFS